jgi:uncharacterized membrane protein
LTGRSKVKSVLESGENAAATAAGAGRTCEGADEDDEEGMRWTLRMYISVVRKLAERREKMTLQTHPEARA